MVVPKNSATGSRPNLVPQNYIKNNINMAKAPGISPRKTSFQTIQEQLRGVQTSQNRKILDKMGSPTATGSL
jgi:hypothetical protein